jgi:medium-chain acyl-[acyl-carrier-protein] hydrolase
MNDALWLPKPRPLARMRLYCLAHAGAGASTFAKWPALAPETIEVAAIRLPGRESRMDETPFRNFADASRTIVDAITRDDPRPFALFGHSAGGKLAAHVAARLDGTARAPAHVFVSAARVTVPADEVLHALPDREFARRVNERFGALSEEITGDPELWSLFEPPLRADLEALETDTLAPRRLGVPMTVIAGSRDEVVDRDDLAHWRAWCARQIRYVVVDADHYSYRMNPKPYMDVIVRQLLG